MFGVHLWKWCGTATQKHIGSSPTINGTKTTVDTTKNNTLPGRLGHFNIVQHISTYFNCGLLFHLFHHTCAHPFHTQRAAGADGLPFARGPQVAHLAAGEVSGLWRLLRTEERAYSGWPWRTNEIMRGKVGKNNYSDNTDNSDIIVIILIIVIVVIIMIVIIMIIVIMLIIVTMM